MCTIISEIPACAIIPARHNPPNRGESIARDHHLLRTIEESGPVVASLKFGEEIMDLGGGSLSVIPARLGCLVVGQPFDRLRAGSFQAVVLTGWKAGPTIRTPDCRTGRAAAIVAPASSRWT